MKKFFKIIILIAFLVNSVLPGYAQGALGPGAGVLPEPGTMVSVSSSFSPPLLTGIKIDVKQPFNFNFILDAGDTDQAAPLMKDAAGKLIRYFMAALAIPENDLWVNLSPYEKDRIVPDAFGVTEMGRDLLAQDYLLKQITASLLYPEGETGKAFWAEIYKKAQAQFGTTDIPTDTFNKVWIVPAKAVVYEEGNKALVVEARLKVMLESDYTVMEHHVVDGVAPSGSPVQDMAKEVIRQIVIPVLEKEVNEGRNFVQLRQVYHSLILAKWYKENLKQSILSRAYADQRKVRGIEIDDKTAKDEIYARYLEAFRKGAFNYVRDEVDPVSQEAIARKYFSGGVNFLGLKIDRAQTTDFLEQGNGRQFDVQTRFEGAIGEDLPVEKMDDWHFWREANRRSTHGTLYLNGDGTRVLKFLNKVNGVKDEHVREFFRIIQGLPEKLREYGYTGPVQVLVPELVRTDDGRLALRRDLKKGTAVQDLMDYRIADEGTGPRYHASPKIPSNEELIRIIGDFLNAVDAVTGGKADRRSYNNLSNFLVREGQGQGYEIFNIDPVSVIAVLKDMVVERRSLAASLKKLFIRKKVQELPEQKDPLGLPVVDMKDWKIWFWPNLRAGQSRIYISRDRKQILKVFNVKNMREEHVREMHDIISSLPQKLKEKGYQGPVEVVVPKLVRVHNDGLGLLTERKKGFMFEKTTGRRLSVHDQKQLQAIAEDFFEVVDDIEGEGMADRRGIETVSMRRDEIHYWNFIWDKDAQGQERIYNIDPIDMVVLMERAAQRMVSGVMDDVRSPAIDELKKVFLEVLEKQEIFSAVDEQAFKAYQGRDMRGHAGALFLMMWDVVRRSCKVVLHKLGDDKRLLAVFGKDISGTPFTRKVIFTVPDEGLSDPEGMERDDVERLIDASFDAAALSEPLDQPTREWLNERLQIEDGKFFIIWGQVEGTKLFTVWEDARYEIVDDKFDAQGRLDKTAIEPGQVMLSDVLVTSPMGMAWTKDDGFHALQFFVQGEGGHASGLLALKWWLRNAREKDNGKARAQLMPFFKARNDPQFTRDNADAGMLTPTGGIDLNANNMNVETTGSGVGFEIPADIQDAAPGGLEDLRPVIMSIIPVRGVSAFLERP
jgi:hypothetical protein